MAEPLVVDPDHLTITTTRAGDGVNFPAAGAKLKMHYTGTVTATGDKFDSSRDRGKPFECTIGVGRLIKGWDEGVPKMSLGQRAILTISSDWGYGASGHPPKIPPAAGLTFDVELLQIFDEATGKWLRAYTDEEKALFRSKLEEWSNKKMAKVRIVVAVSPNNAHAPSSHLSLRKAPIHSVCIRLDPHSSPCLVSAPAVQWDEDESFREKRVEKYTDRAGFAAFLAESVEKKMSAVQ
jgi:FK506-binding protein 1|tara:strand:+ start:225 stop:935 length:711 start_codon:yes stop_codon:yes gene_type:complete